MSTNKDRRPILRGKQSMVSASRSTAGRESAKSGRVQCPPEGKEGLFLIRILLVLVLITEPLWFFAKDAPAPPREQEDLVGIPVSPSSGTIEGGTLIDPNG